ncbi:MAG TPA: hypothetical protein VEL07_07455 [Planctomycetota bacterium]|nr:hypothetical protein [Planctomycetota bacterium]
MASRSASKSAVSRARTGSRAAPAAKAGRAHAAKKNIDAHRRAPVDLGYRDAEERGHARDGAGRDAALPRKHHVGGGDRARPAMAPKRRAIQHRVAVPPPQRQRRRRRASAGE